MNSLIIFDQKHPFLTAFIGTVSGAISWIMQNLEIAQRVVGLIGATAATLVSLITLAVKLRAIFTRPKLPRRDPTDDIPFC